jgi:hypothetical protein
MAMGTSLTTYLSDLESSRRTIRPRVVAFSIIIGMDAIAATGAFGASFVDR